MVKTSSKSVPVVAAVVLLAGVFSVASAHAGFEWCQDELYGGKPECQTKPLFSLKGKLIDIIASAKRNGVDSSGTYTVYRDKSIWKIGVFTGYTHQFWTTSMAGSYKAKVTGLKPLPGIVNASRVDIMMSTL